MGDVIYSVKGFSTKNTNILKEELILTCKSSKIKLLQELFNNTRDNLMCNNSEGSTGRKNKQKPKSSGTTIREQARNLVETLKKCVPHYVRCIKPSESKKPGDWDTKNVTR